MTSDPADPKVRPTARPLPHSTSLMASMLWLAALAITLSLHVWFPRIDAAVNDTYNVDVGGRNALYQFAERRIEYVNRNHEPLANWLDRFDYESTFCLLGPARYPSPREWQALLTWVDGGGKLLVAARWNDADLAIPGIQARVKSTVVKKPFKIPGADNRKKSRSSPSRSGTDSSEDEKSIDTAEQVAVAVPVSTTLAPGTDFTWKTEGVIDQSGFDQPGAQVLVSAADGPQAVRIHHGQGSIVLVATDFIFSNAALHDREHKNAVLAVKLLESAGAADAVVFDESLNETGTPKVVGVLLDPSLRPATIQLVALIVLFGWRGNSRFGALLPRSAQARHDMADHTTRWATCTTRHTTELACCESTWTN